jgi:hypothetical protein
VVRRGFLLSGALAAACTAFGTSSTPGEASNVPDASADANEARTDASTEADAQPMGDGGSHIAFLTSETFTGAEASDKRCNDAVQGIDSFKGRTFKAFLSYTDAGAISRLTDYGPWFLLNDGGQVAKRASQLLKMDRPIIIDENGEAHTEVVYAWTGTDGTTGITLNTCQNWIIADNSADGMVGYPDGTEVINWIHWGDHTCDSRSHLYCFEQPSDAGP